jgi:uncharacterized membrane-anchored protein
MKTTARWFWAVVISQAVFLLAWAGWHEHVRSNAEVILLKTRPVDPQDLLRGDYMILGYEIADVALPVDGDNWQECWVVLELREGYHAGVRASIQRPEVTRGQIAVRARKHRRGLMFGIESYYVPEGMGTPRFDKIEVEAAVSAANRLQIKRVLLDGKEYP